MHGICSVQSFPSDAIGDSPDDVCNIAMLGILGQCIIDF